MARKVQRKGKGISESQDSQLQETQSTRPSFDHNEVCEQELSQILRPSSEPRTDERALQASNSIIIGTSAGKKKGRGKAKGINAGDGEIEVEIYDGKHLRDYHSFSPKLNGAWTTFVEYPNSELETLYARYRAQRFKHKQPDEEVKKAFVESVKHRYSDWMFRIRNPIFQKYEKKEDRYKNGHSFIPNPFWKEMVDKWMAGEWGETSLTNKDNRNKFKIFSTVGSAPMANYRYEMYLETGSEPSPIDCFKKFHTKKDGKEWATDHAKTIYACNLYQNFNFEKMDAIKAKVVSEGTKTNDYQIFREVVGEPSHGRVLGMGIGIKAKDMYGLTSSGKGCSKRCREDFTKEKEDLEARLREEMDSKLTKVVEKLEEKFAQKLQSMGIPQQSDIDAATMDGTSKDEEDNSNNNIEVENNLESDSEED
ncbi:hypothetical protein SO802_006875 [Lithocarpus litseifolius]|uniref:Transposase, Ptta/En/Spm, plant n=1 Tax=Lithocarpus litseifolius TaxID=425828 RepID=A0AAW2DM35_9ROSI